MKKNSILLFILSVLPVLTIVSSAQAVSYRFDTTAMLQEYPYTAGITVDMAILTGKNDIQIRRVVVRAKNQNNTHLLSARLDKIKGVYRILWRMPAAKVKSDIGSKINFVVTLIPGNKKLSSQPLSGKKVNLVYNGGFKKLNSYGQPKGMRVNYATFKKRFRTNMDSLGNHYLSFNIPQKGRRGPIYYSPWLSITPGEMYVCSFSYKVENAELVGHRKYSFTSDLMFRDATGKRLPFIRALSCRKTNTNGWKTYSIIITAPSNATGMYWYIRNRNGRPYAVSFDNVRIAPAVLPQITKLQTSTGKDLNLRASSPNIRRFDLGPAGSPLWPGYTALTPKDKYSAKRGYGFTKLTRGFARNRVRPNSLTADFISAADAQLRVNIPNGEYKIYMISGDSQVGFSSFYTLYFGSSITIGKKKSWYDDTTPAEFFKNGYYKHYYDFWYPGMSYYRTFVAPHFTTHHFTAQAKKGHLTIFWRNLPVDAIIIAPQSLAIAMDREMAALKKQRRRATQITVIADPKQPAPKLTDTDKSRGFVLFAKPANVLVYPTSRPTSKDRINSLNTFAAKGQYQSVHFSLYPVQNLGNTTVTATELKSKNGSAIPASKINIRILRYGFKEQYPSKSIIKADYRYKIAPATLDHHSPVLVTKNTTWTWWATFHIPENTKAGIYEGFLKIVPENGNSYSLPLKVRVLPFTLKPLGIIQGYYWRPNAPWYSLFWRANVHGPHYFKYNKKVRAILKSMLRRNFAFMKKLGLNSVALADDIRGGLVYKDSKIELKKDNRFTLFMDLYAQAGMKAMPFYSFQHWIRSPNHLGWLVQNKSLYKQFTKKWDRVFRDFVIDTNAMAKKRHWPKIIWYISDEAGNIGIKGVKQAIEAADLLKNIPGVTTISSMNHAVGYILPAHVDISMPNIGYPITKKTIKMIRDEGSKFWIYNAGYSRLSLGLYPWRVGAGGRFQWFYCYQQADPWDDLDGEYGNSIYSICRQGPNGPVGNLRSEWLRSGITDHRYANTLQAAIKSAENNPAKKQIVAEAKEFIKDIKSKIPIDLRTLATRHDAKAADSKLQGSLMNTLNHIRWGMAHYIIELKK